jgi:hypothetical protein
MVTPVLPNEAASARGSLIRYRTTKVFAFALVVALVLQLFWQQLLSPNVTILRGTTREKPSVSRYGSGRQGGVAPMKTLSIGDLKDVNDDALTVKSNSNSSLGGDSWETAILHREPILALLEEAGIKIDLDVLQTLPEWSKVKQLYGDKPGKSKRHWPKTTKT